MNFDRCKCGTSFAGTAGCHGGIFEYHGRDACEVTDTRTWRQRLLWPVARFFNRLAGPAKGPSAPQEN